MIAAGIDIGSNSVRLLIADVKNGKINKVIYEDRKITRLAENINLTKKLSKDAIKRTIGALFSFDEQIKKYRVEKIKAVATSAVREAENKEEFLKQAETLSFNIEIINGNLESKLTFYGVKAGIDTNGKSSLLLDIGGGSTEFVFHNGKDIVYNKSIPYGVVKLAEIFDFFNPVDEKTVNDFNIFTERNIFEQLSYKIKPEIFLATAGTPTTLAAISLEMEKYNPNIINGFKLKIEEVEKIFKTLCKLNAKERLHIKGMEKGREDLIIPGILILLETMEKFNFNEMIVCGYGLREGVTIAAAL